MQRSILLAGIILFNSAALAEHTTSQDVAPQDAVSYETQRCERAFDNRNYARAHQICRPLADADDSTAQFIIGVMYQNGQGTPRNPREAAAWYTKAGEQGHPGAQYNLGSMYRYGSGVWQDFVEAYVWLDVAATLGHADAPSARDIVVRRLSGARLAEAKRRSAELLDGIRLARAPAYQEDAAPESDDARVQEIIDRLRAIVRQARREHTAEPRLIQQLRDLMREYDWPWRVALLDDDFRDGNFTSDPTWAVHSGEFRVEREVGLRSRLKPRRRRAASRSTDQDLGTRLFGAIITEALRQPGDSPSDRPTHGEIQTTLDITNAFAVKVEMTLIDTRDKWRGAIQFGPYQGYRRETGYRLQYNSGKRPFVQLLRIFPTGAAVVEAADLDPGFDDGKLHTFEWRRDRDGEMIVLVDGKEVIRAVDRGIRNSFDGFAIVNLGGDYGIRRVALVGAKR